MIIRITSIVPCNKTACHTHPYPTFTPSPNALYEDHSNIHGVRGHMYLRLTQTCLVTHTFALPLTTTVQAGNNLSSSSEFARLKQLMKLSVALNNFPNASGLSALTRLTSLYIQHNNLDNAALAEIAKTLPSLFELQIQYNPRITSLGALATMPELMFVDAGHTNVTRQASNTKISTFLDGTAYCDGAYTSNSKVQCTPCCCSATRYDCATYMYGPPFNSYSSTLILEYTRSFGTSLCAAIDMFYACTKYCPFAPPSPLQLCH